MRYASERGYEAVAELAEVASGVSLERPKLNQMMALARGGEFEVLVVLVMDRLSRDADTWLNIETGLKQAEIRIECVLGEYPTEFRRPNLMTKRAVRDAQVAVTTEAGLGVMFAAGELAQVLWAWVNEEGDLFGLLGAWWEVVSGQVAIGDKDE